MFVVYDKEKYSTQRIPIKVWLEKFEDLEEGALKQAMNLASLPFATHVALMPDTHQGYGMCVGGVLATDHVIIPNAVGVDIGCGMAAVRTTLTEIDKEVLKEIMGEIRQAVPVGFNKHHDPQNIDVLIGNNPLVTDLKWYPVVSAELSQSRYSLGTLGGGNHFIEIQEGNDGFIWFMLHSGSRNLGKKVCDHYNDLARHINQRYFSTVPDEWELAFLPTDSNEAASYEIEMKYCMDFAMANRQLMVDRIKDILIQKTHCSVAEEINIHHNYAQQEYHYGKNLWVHRKGATLVRNGELGIIPGSQGTASYIVKGKGNPESLLSCSHGAGRRMGRNVAVKTLDLEAEKKRLDDMGVIHAIRNLKDLEEAPSAYKDIDKVMENQKDLVDIVVKLRPLAVIKG